jgi:ribose-phosphate pyrophosphokinase
VEGKDVIIIDDMISSGESMLDVAKQLKDRKANRIIAASTFGLFTGGLQKFKGRSGKKRHHYRRVDNQLSLPDTGIARKTLVHQL